MQVTKSRCLVLNYECYFCIRYCRQSFCSKEKYCLTEDNSFDKDIPDADGKKTIQHHIENVRKKMHLTQ